MPSAGRAGSVSGPKAIPHCGQGAKRTGGLLLTSGDNCNTVLHITNGYTHEATMSVRKRTWTTRKGETKEAWIVDYTDQNGKRHLKTFSKKKQADAFATTAKVQVRHGIHTADSESVTVAAAGGLWLAAAEKNELERTTVDQYQQHLDLHIAPYLGRVKLSQLTAPMVREFEDKLSHGIPAPGSEDNAPRSPAMVRKIRGSLGSILADAQERGLVARNVVRELRSNRRRGKERRAERRQKGKLKVGVNIPNAGRDQAHPQRGVRPAAAIADDSDLRRPTRVGASWSALGGRRSQARRTAGPAARGPVWRHWQAEIAICGADNPARPACAYGS